MGFQGIFLRNRSVTTIPNQAQQEKQDIAIFNNLYYYFRLI